MSRKCTLLLPALLAAPEQPRSAVFAQLERLAGLELFFSRADKQPVAAEGLSAVLFDLFDVQWPREDDAPIAAVTYAVDSEEAQSGACLRADPVHLVADRDHLVLMGPESLSLSQAEADRLVADLNVVFSADGWRFEAATASRWYLHLPATAQLRTYALDQVNGRAIGEFLPLGPQAQQWRRSMNEIQMLLHTSTVNVERQALGQLPVSSVWFWGGGKMPEMRASAWGQLYANDAVAQGLATLSAIACDSLPRRATECLQTPMADGDYLLVLDSLQDKNTETLPEAWGQRVSAIEKQWITPLLSALRKGVFDEMVIHLCQGEQYTLSRAHLKRWWRRKRPLSFYG
jgi:hypothetical protein